MKLFLIFSYYFAHLKTYALGDKGRGHVIRPLDLDVCPPAFVEWDSTGKICTGQNGANTKTRHTCSRVTLHLASLDDLDLDKMALPSSTNIRFAALFHLPLLKSYIIYDINITQR